MMSVEHSAALVAFQEVLSAAIEPTGLKWTMQGYAGKTIKGTTQSKQGDGGWAPKRPPDRRAKKWPAVVLEVVVSLPHSKVLFDVHFWLYESQADVKVVLALIVNNQTTEITIEKWELNNGCVHCTRSTTVSQ